MNEIKDVASIIAQRFRLQGDFVKNVALKILGFGERRLGTSRVE